MISRQKNRKILVEMQDENIEIKSLPSVFRSLVGISVYLQRSRQKGEFLWTFLNIRDN